jgi:hypothetical protein
MRLCFDIYYLNDNLRLFQPAPMISTPITEDSSAMPSLATSSNSLDASASTSAAEPSGQTHEPVNKRFRYLSKRVSELSNNSSPSPETKMTHSESIKKEIETYTELVRSGRCDFPEGRVISFWLSKADEFPLLASISMDLLSLPASEAYAERVFSVCGDMTRGKRNRKSVTLERSVFLKVNRALLG